MSNLDGPLIGRTRIALKQQKKKDRRPFKEEWEIFLDLFWDVRVVLRKVDATTQVRKSGITLLVWWLVPLSYVCFL